ncbi:MAG: transposase [Chloroflexota bacterium]
MMRCMGRRGRRRIFGRRGMKKPHPYPPHSNSYALPTKLEGEEKGSRVEKTEEEAVLPDERLAKRLALLVEQFSQAPGQSIPQVCGSVHDTKAAYRFLG